MVVDTDVTSKLLLQRGQLQTRTTIIPLNKITGHVIDRQTVQLAQQIVSIYVMTNIYITLHYLGNKKKNIDK